MPEILCVPAEHADDCLNPKHHVWIERSVAETDDRYRQVIPYVIVARNGRVLSYRRKGNEQRLHGKMSIGVGGHIDKPEAFFQAIHREIDEELLVELDLNDIKIHGKIILSETEVDRVHVGVIVHMDATEYDLDDLEFSDEIRDPKWLTWEELKAHYGELEAWSQYIVDNINGLAT